MPEIAVIPLATEIAVIATQVVSSKNVHVVIGALMMLFLASILLSLWRAAMMLHSFVVGYTIKQQPREAEPTPMIERGKFYEALYKPRVAVDGSRP